MTEQTQKELLELSKKALQIISMLGNKNNTDFVFSLRDTIRKAESEDERR